MHNYMKYNTKNPIKIYYGMYNKLIDRSIENEQEK